MENTVLYYVQTNGTDAVNRRRFSAEELEYQNQGCPEGWQWVLDNVQTDARPSFAAVPHVAPVSTPQRLFSFTFTENELEQLAFAAAMWKQACERETRPEHVAHYRENVRTMENLLLQFDGAQPLAESSPTVQKYRKSHPSPARCEKHAWQDAFGVDECPYCLASVIAPDPSPVTEADIYRADAEAEGEDYQRELEAEAEAAAKFTGSDVQLDCREGYNSRPYVGGLPA